MGIWTVLVQPWRQSSLLTTTLRLRLWLLQAPATMRAAMVGSLAVVLAAVVGKDHLRRHRRHRP